MHIGIIGTINHDKITMPNGLQINDLGGILYNITVLADLIGEKDLLFPISQIGADYYDKMKELLALRAGVKTCGISISPKGTSKNEICYDSSMEKIERLTNHINPISFEQIEPNLGVDALLVNFIVGDDISLDTMRMIRTRFSGLLYLDVHNLCLGIDRKGFRQPRAPDNWQGWIEMFDIVQMNDVEAHLLAGRILNTIDDYIDFGEKLLPLGPYTLIITRGPRGSITVFRDNSKIESIVTPPERVPKMVDTTGCGDAFAAGFLVAYLTTKELNPAIQLGTKVATLNCSIAGMPNVGYFRHVL